MKILCEGVIWVYFREYVESYGYTVENGYVLLYNDAIPNGGGYHPVDSSECIVFMARFNIEWLKWNSQRIITNEHGDSVPNGLPKHVICWNTEQFTRHGILTLFINRIIELERIFPGLKYSIFDYSKGNIEILNKHGYESYYLPYMWNEKEQNMFKKLKQEVIAAGEEGMYDIGFIGTSSEYRNKILLPLIEKGYKFAHLVGWNEVRDKGIMKCKIIINIHFVPEYTIYESIRCDRLIFAGCNILSENSIDDNFNDLKEYISICPHDELLNKCEKMITEWNKDNIFSIDDNIITKRFESKQIFDMFNF
jgi:hypothetical protein